jgi:hypothetical protein
VRRPSLKHPRFQETEKQSDAAALSSPAQPIRHGSVDLPRKRLAVALVSDAKNCALIRIAERQRHKFARNLPRLIGGHAARFKQFR